MYLRIFLHLWASLIPCHIFCFSYTHFSDGTFTSIHVLVVSPKEASISPVRANGEKVKRETVAALAIRYGAAAAINGGFWKSNGDPAGALKISHHWHGTPKKPRETFLKKRHPRTAIGINSAGDWIFVVVDGRFYGQFGGRTIKELACFMLDLGCVEALNLDGGGSSTMVLNGIVINEPCGTLKENDHLVETVSDAILIFPKITFSIDH